DQTGEAARQARIEPAGEEIERRDRDAFRRRHVRERRSRLGHQRDREPAGSDQVAAEAEHGGGTAAEAAIGQDLQDMRRAHGNPTPGSAGRATARRSAAARRTSSKAAVASIAGAAPASPRALMRARESIAEASALPRLISASVRSRPRL